MKRLRFIYKPVAEMQFTQRDVEVLKRCSETHYDFKCRSMSQAGGMLVGWANRFTWEDHGPTFEVDLPWSDLDTLCKVVEFPPPDVEAEGREIHRRLATILQEMNLEYRRLNPEPEAKEA